MKNLSIFIFLFIFLGIYAQTTNPIKNVKNDKIKIAIIPGFSDFDFSSLNKSLQANGLPKVNDGLQYTTMASVSFPIVGMQWDVTGGISRSENQTNGFDVNQRSVFLEYGMQLFQYKKKNHYAFFGIAFGLTSSQVDIYENQNSENFTDALENFNGALSLNSNNNSYIALKTGYDWHIKPEGSFLLGFRLGYRIGLDKQQWAVNGQTYNDSPDSSANGLYFGVSLSFQ
jgi:hypothetical protein